MGLNEFRSQKLTWNRANNQTLEKLYGNAGDSNGRKLVVQVINDATTEDLSGNMLSLAWSSNKNQGLDAFTEIDASEGLYEIYYTTEMLSNIGTIQASLVLITESERIESRAFQIVVERSVVDDEVVQSDNSFTALTQALARVIEYQSDIADKVDKVSGKGLSTNDYTTTEKNKLNGIQAGAEVNTVTSVADKTGAVTVNKSDVGLSNVDNVKQATKTEHDALDARVTSCLAETATQINDLETSKAEKTEVNATNLRVDNLVIPISPENVNIEVTDAHNSLVKNKNFSSLKERLEESENDLNQHKLDYMEQMDFKITNGIKNEISTNGWSPLNINYTITEFADRYRHENINDGRQYNYFLNKGLSYKTGDKIYINLKFLAHIGTNTYAGTPRVGLDYGNSFRSNLFTTPDMLCNAKGVVQANANGSIVGVFFTIYTPVIIGHYLDIYKDSIAINLTETFGVGNEPTKEEMDLLIALLGGWFDGEITPTQKQLTNLHLKNRNNTIVKDNLDNSYKYWLSIEDGILQFNYEGV